MLGVDVMCQHHPVGIASLNQSLHLLHPLSITGHVYTIVELVREREGGMEGERESEEEGERESEEGGGSCGWITGMVCKLGMRQSLIAVSFPFHIPIPCFPRTRNETWDCGCQFS